MRVPQGAYHVCASCFRIGQLVDLCVKRFNFPELSMDLRALKFKFVIF